MKNILIICSNVIAALQIKTHYLKNKDINRYIILVERNNRTQEIINIFKNFKNKEIYKLNPIQRPIYFSLREFYNFEINKKRNKRLQKKIKKNKKLKLILKHQYSEVSFSNDNYSKLILYKKKVLKNYFSHGLTDFLIDLKYLNFFTTIKRKIEDYINNNFLYAYKPSSNNSKIYCVFNHFVKKKFLPPVDKNKFKTVFIDNIVLKKKKFFQNKKINLINISIPYSYYKKKYPAEVLNSYISYFQKKILNKIITETKEIYIFKFKESIPINLRKKIIKKFQNKFKNFLILLYSKKITGVSSLEQFVYLYDVIKYFSTFSSSMFFIKLIKPEVKIYNMSTMSDNFWHNKEELLFKNHRQNRSNLLKLINQYKKKWKNI